MRHVGSEISKTASSASSWVKDAWQRNVVTPREQQGQGQQQQQQQQGGGSSPGSSRWGKLIGTEMFNRSSETHSIPGVSAPVVFTQPAEQRMSKGSHVALQAPQGEMGTGAAGATSNSTLLRAFGSSVGAVPSAAGADGAMGVTSPRLTSLLAQGGAAQRQQDQTSLI
jgi:hypothetical protein